MFKRFFFLRLNKPICIVYVYEKCVRTRYQSVFHFSVQRAFSSRNLFHYFACRMAKRITLVEKCELTFTDGAAKVMMYKESFCMASLNLLQNSYNIQYIEGITKVERIKPFYLTLCELFATRQCMYA